ncbi:hypothetical protein [Thermus caliditerrae]|uniref:hypothetical protein n=1 Tax=Thermus caliditerrae TaxID=1330700 RepID=UPI0005713496|nr:hypothetical protein [Thermus caliditerrae]
MNQAQAFAKRVQRVALNRQGTEAQVFLEAGFLYLRQDAFARFAQGEGAEALAGFVLERGGVRLRFRDGSTLTLAYRLGRLRVVLE